MFQPTPDEETNIIVARTLGITFALLVWLLATRFVTILTGMPVRHHQFRRY